MLNALQAISDEKTRQSTEALKVITFPPLILWDILAPSYGQSTKETFQTPDTTQSEDTRMRVRTQWAHPLTENHSAPSSDVAAVHHFNSNLLVPSGGQLDALAGVSVDDLLTQFPENDFFYPGYNVETM